MPTAQRVMCSRASGRKVVEDFFLFFFNNSFCWEFGFWCGSRMKMNIISFFFCFFVASLFCFFLRFPSPFPPFVGFFRFRLFVFKW